MEVFLYCMVVGDTFVPSFHFWSVYGDTFVGDTFARVFSFEVCTATLSYTYGLTGKVGESVADNRAV